MEVGVNGIFRSAGASGAFGLLHRRFAPHALVALIVLLGSIAYATWSAAQIRADILRRSLAELSLAGAALSTPLNFVTSDLHLMARDSTVSAAIEPSTEARMQAIRLFKDLLGERTYYRGIRLLDHAGQEVIFVRSADAGGNPVAQHDLANRQDADYFQGARALKLGQIFFSPIALRTDDEKVVTPYVPIMRFSTPLRSPSGADGVLVLTMTMSHTFERVEGVFSVGIGEGWMFDADGFLLAHPQKSLLFGRQLNPEHVAAKLYPELWRAIREGQIQWNDPNGLFAMHPVKIESGGESLVGDPVSRGFELVERIAPATMAAQLPSAFNAGFWLALALALVGTELISGSLARARHAAEAESRLRVLAQNEAREREAIREEVYRTSLAMQGTSDPRGFALAVLAELAPLLSAGCAALFRIDESGGRFRLLGGYALSAKAADRKLWIGQGAMGEAVRHRRTIVLEPVPVSYAHDIAAEGAVMPRIIVIIPLWARTQTIGVLELGLLRTLNKHQQEILGQLLPFIALNLDGLLSSPYSE